MIKLRNKIDLKLQKNFVYYKIHCWGSGPFFSDPDPDVCTFECTYNPALLYGKYSSTLLI